LNKKHIKTENHKNITKLYFLHLIINYHLLVAEEIISNVLIIGFAKLFSKCDKIWYYWSGFYLQSHNVSNYFNVLEK